MGKQRTPAISVGSHVMWRMGRRDVHAIVVEDRGPIGVQGRRIVRVRAVLDPIEPPLEFEVPVEELTFLPLTELLKPSAA